MDTPLKTHYAYTLWFEQLGLDDIPIAGGKNASLGEMFNRLRQQGIRVPNGFAISAQAYLYYLRENRLSAPIQAALDKLNRGETSLEHTGEKIRELILAGTIPKTLRAAIVKSYRKLTRLTSSQAVAVRSSATAEDLPEASFAGQQASYLNVRGETELLDAYKRCYASLFTDRAISYREAQGFDHLEVAISVGVQAMVHADTGAAGVMFSLDPQTGFPHAAVITAAWGLGEAVVQGRVVPDKYQVYKPLLEKPGLSPIYEKSLGSKLEKLVYSDQGGTEWQATRDEERNCLVLNDAEILQLARWASLIEAHYGCPMDIEWAKDGVSGELFILQARPETSVSQKPRQLLTTYKLERESDILLRGTSIGHAITTGDARVLFCDGEELPLVAQAFPEGAILVAERTDPDWLPIMRRAAGVITDSGGPTSHAAIVCRELKIPAIVGTGNATQVLTSGQALTLSCANADEGHVYNGVLPFTEKAVDLGALPPIETPLMINMAMPGGAQQWWQLPIQGIGLARVEYIISGLIRAHPLVLLKPDQLTDPQARQTIAALTKNVKSPSAFFVDTLARGIATIAASQYPHPAIVRFSDFKSNEYHHLIGGTEFEPVEANPMLGLRGAARYYSKRYREAFALECQAVKKVREQMGFDNVIVMIPFCRTPDEADRVLAIMADNGLVRGEQGLQVYVMCEIPSNVVLADQFARRFDGFSIGTNDLTQLVLGVDRDSAELAYLSDARNEAVKRMITQVIEVAHRYGCKVGICGQAPSDHSEFAEFLVRQGIDSISLNPDSITDTIAHIARAEKGSGLPQRRRMKQPPFTKTRKHYPGSMDWR